MIWCCQDSWLTSPVTTTWSWGIHCILRGNFSLQRLFSMQQRNWGWGMMNALSSINNFVTLTRFKIETVSSVLGSIRKGDIMFFISLKDTHFQIPIHPDFLPYLRITLKKEGFPVQGIVFWPFHSTSGLYQNSFFSVRQGSQERDLAASLLGQLVGCSSQFFFLLEHCMLLLHLCLGLECHQLGEIRPRANQIGGGLSDGLSDYQILRCGGQVPPSSVPTCEDVEAEFRLHGLSGTVCAQR